MMKMKRCLLFLLRTYVLTVLLFIVAKGVFMLCNGTGHDIGFSDFFSVVRHGLTLDLSTALYFLIVPLLVCMASVWIRVPRWVLRLYFALVAIAFALAFVADTSLYAFWGFKLDASCLQYLDQPEGITQSVSVGYLLWRFVVLVAVAIAIYAVLAYSCSFVHSRKGDNSPTGVVQPAGIRKKVRQTVSYVLLMPLMVIGIRGGFGESTTNIGQMYYSQNQFLNHSAVNPVFSFLYSLGHQLGDLSQYAFFDEQECRNLVANVFTTESIDADTLLTTQRPDIVIILMESAGEEFSSVMPRLQQLKQEGINFSQCYGNSWRTDRGTICALSGYPSFPSVSVMKIPEKSRSLPAIARTLSSVGYQTSYLYGGDINFTNMRSYLIATGWQQLTSMDDYNSSDRHSAQWGVRDDITFSTLFDRIVNRRADVTASTPPRLFGYSTLSSHEPWDVPVQRNNDEVLNAFAYLDDCLGNFIDRLRQTPQWQNLLVILTADHGINYGQNDQSHPKAKNHIPMLWLGGAVKEPRQVNTICNQSDLAATLLGQLGLSHSDFAFSRDVLSATYTYPTAVHNYNNAQWLCDSTGHVLYDFDANRFIVSESADANRLLRVSKAILQTTTADLTAVRRAEASAAEGPRECQ